MITKKNLILIAIVTSIFVIVLIGRASALCELQDADIGTFKQNSVVNLWQTCPDCSYVNISQVLYPNSSQALGQVQMTNQGTTFNYSFDDTTQLGDYVYKTYGNSSANGICTQNVGFTINGSGQKVGQPQIMLIMIGIFVMLIVVAFFFILSLMFKHPGTKIFLMALSAISLIVLIGIVVSNAAVYLAEFAGLVEIYNTYYIAIVALASAAMMGLIVWLIYYSFTLFNKTRGTRDDDD